MSKQASTTVIGGFVIGAIALIVMAIIIFGSGQFFNKQLKFVVFFNESVKGLNVGAPVDFKGVKVGTVTDIKLMLDPSSKSLAIPVYIELNDDSVTLAKSQKWDLPWKQGSGVLVKHMIEEGLRAQLVSQSLVTGQMGIHLDFFPDKPAKLTGEDPSVPEIPSTGSALSELARTVEEIPIQEIANKVLLTFSGVEKLVNSPDAQQIVANINATMRNVEGITRKLDADVQPLTNSTRETIGEIRQLVQSLDSKVKPLASSVEQTMKDADILLRNIDGRVPQLVARIDETLKTANTAMSGANKSLDGMTGQSSAVRYEMVRALNELSGAARSIRVIADYLERHPDSVIRGKKEY